MKRGKKLKTGISIYLSSGLEKNEEVIGKAKVAGVTYGFTSLHIPEEEYSDYKEKVTGLLKLCAHAGISLTMDVDNDTPFRLGVKRMEDLIDYGVESIRLDFGFSDEEIVELSRNFNIIWNASTVSISDVCKWEKMGADLTRFTACHNFYPKPYTGLSFDMVKEIDQKLKQFGFMTEGFVPGDGILRGPLFEGLPTIEDHRHKKEKLLDNMLQLYQADCDVVLIGDVDLTDNSWKLLKAASEGIIPIRAQFYDGFFDIANQICGKLSHDRPDSGSFVIRTVESRDWFKQKDIPSQNTISCEAGSICISNDAYLRYKGEVEICRCERPADERINVIGKVIDEDLGLLPYITKGAGFIIENSNRMFHG